MLFPPVDLAHRGAIRYLFPGGTPCHPAADIDVHDVELRVQAAEFVECKNARTLVLYNCKFCLSFHFESKSFTQWMQALLGMLACEILGFLRFVFKHVWGH